MTNGMVNHTVLSRVLDKTHLREVFFETLRHAGVTSKSALDEIRIDFNVCDSISPSIQCLQKVDGLQNLTTGDRKQFFSEYQAQASKREKEESRLRKQSAREEFRELLEHWGEEGELDVDITFRQIASACSSMAFWQSLDPEELDDIFQDFMGSYETNSRHLIKEKRHERKRELFRLFEERWASTPHLPTWEDAQLVLSQNPTVGAGLDLLDRFEVFEDFVIEKFEKRREERRRQERREGRRKRDAFAALVESFKTQILQTETEPLQWADFQPLVKNHREYIDLIGTRNSSQPYDLFAEMRSKWKHGFDTSLKRSLSADSHDSDRKRLKP